MYLLCNISNIETKFQLQRRSNFTIFTLIKPLLMLAFFDICIKEKNLVPIGSDENNSFSITIYITFGIFVTNISDTVTLNSLHVTFFVLCIVIPLSPSFISVFYTTHADFTYTPPSQVGGGGGIRILELTTFK
ncbi:hypothetical protein DPMN_086207 [Dreissena polymorpha]|uniref:Uncharacterized protein n=1 Tax=Dreissena polymorpha TaxID=45954 RepID=A0A9D4BKZ9_DREPO|nr:hypothetical protein DPMN_086207 [Dreissena polymorpha]